MSSTQFNIVSLSGLKHPGSQNFDNGLAAQRLFILTFSIDHLYFCDPEVKAGPTHTMIGFVPGAVQTTFVRPREGQHICRRRQNLLKPQQCDGCKKSVIACAPLANTKNEPGEILDPSQLHAESETEIQSDLVEEVAKPGGISNDFLIAPKQDYVNIVRNVDESSKESGPDSSAPLDLLELDMAGRKSLDSGSYASVVDVDITAGGLLNVVDNDNNELFCGVGMDALLEDERLIENLEKEFSITTTTHVQLAAIPRIQEGASLVIQGHTGTGKTLSFLLPMLESIETEFPNVQAAVVAPTRELAMQIANECARLCAGTDIITMPLIGGANPARQVEKLRKRVPHVIIGTPGRMAELEEARAFSLRRLRMMVIDEVDQCLLDPFRESIERLMKYCPKHRQMVLVSATGDVDLVREFATEHMKDSMLLRVGDKQKIPKNITNWYVIVPQRLRIDTVRKLMFTEPIPNRAICFVDDPRRADMVVERLFKMKVPAAALRGNAHKLERAEVVKAFRQGRVKLLVTTEIAARGLDVPEVTHVFNLDLPTDADHYVHRAGRCGRVGAQGVVVSIGTPENGFVINRLEKHLNLKITRMEPRGGQFEEPLVRKSVPRPRVDTPRVKTQVQTREKPAAPRPSSSKVDYEARAAGPAPMRPGKPSAKAAAPVNTTEKVKRGGKKKKRSKPGTALPKGRHSKADIARHAKAHGWVGNRGN